MSVKTSVQISVEQEDFARQLVEEGRFDSVSAVVERGLELVREETEWKADELEALKALLDERRKGPFLSEEESHKQIQEMIARKRAAYGLQG